MDPTLKKILAPFASLRVTVVLLAAAMVPIFAGTNAQRETGIWQIQHRYFHNVFTWINIRDMLPFVKHPPGGGFPFLGGYTLIGMMLVNLLAAHTVRFKFNWKRSGILLTHFGLILLLVGEIVTSVFAVESVMPIDQGGTTPWSQDIREPELAIVDTAPSDHDDVVVIPAARLEKAGTIQDKRLPFDVKVVKYYPNSVIPALLGPFQKSQITDRGDALSNSGLLKGQEIISRPAVAGTEGQAVDAPSAFVQFSSKGKDLGTYLVSLMVPDQQQVEVDGKTYSVNLRFKRLYKPYTVTLLKFSHDKYAGTDVARNFASRIRFLDPANGVDRELTIRMNEPLRYRNETFYQQSFNQDQLGNATGTVLQVVKNPGWWAPYLAVLIGAAGLIIHFGITLVNFLHRTAKERGAYTFYAPTGPFSAIVAVIMTLALNRTPPPPVQKQLAASGGRKGKGDLAKAYSLQPSRGWASWATLVPAGIIALFVLYVLGHLAPRPYVSKSGLDLESFARVPVLLDGRPMPMDSVARGSLKMISGRESIKLDNGVNFLGMKFGGDTIPAVQWMADVLANNEQASEYKVIRIDHPQVKSLLDLDPSEKLFSVTQVMGDGNSARLEEQYERLPGDDKTWDPYQKKIAELHKRMEIFARFSVAKDFMTLQRALDDKESFGTTMALAQSTKGLARSEWTREQRDAMENVRSREEAMRRLEWMAKPDRPQNKKFDLYFAAPTQRGEEWQGLGLSILAGMRNQHVNPTVETWFSMIKALHDGKASTFNVELATYQKALEKNPPANADTADFETAFNRFDPFMLSMVIYIAVFVFAAASWLGFRKPLARTAVGLGVLALIIHTVGIVARMYISGRPPVTNLYSSALFIGWGAVILGLILEGLFRNGIGSTVVGIMGFSTLLVAGGLYVRETDTMAPLQAVLDTNFWLATHVVVITLGYASTFLAGLIAIVYVVGGFFTPALDGNIRKSLSRMVYGILCFAMISSFVGTILGGIWADQSWGRFWGWDPKENGAILIVLWNALILHARWCGLARERGVMLLAIGGNIVTAWSWFGTNMLGVGLHSYGFMESALLWLLLFWVLCVGLIILGNFPKHLWRSFATQSPQPS